MWENLSVLKTSDSIKILIIDDHEIVVCGLKHIINSSLPEIRHIDTATSGRGALEMIAAAPYDIYLIDLELPDISGIDLIASIRNNYPHARIIVNTMHDELWYNKQLDSLDIDGVVYKSVDSQQIVAAITSVLCGEKYRCTPGPSLCTTSRRRTQQLGKELSRRELEVLRCISQGKSTAEIAAELYISVNTVETHHRHLNEKLDASNMASLIMHAVAKGLLPIR